MRNRQKGSTPMWQRIGCWSDSETKITSNQKAHCKSTLQCVFKCARRDSNPRHLASENYDTARNMMIHCDFLLVLHCYGTPITNNIKQCANDKNWPPAAKITASGQLVVTLRDSYFLIVQADSARRKSRLWYEHRDLIRLSRSKYNSFCLPSDECPDCAMVLPV